MQTHSWITFEADLSRTSPGAWMLLGEARSKCEHIAGVPLKPGVAQDLHILYLAKGVHATTAIEGNTLTEEDAKLLIAGKLDVPKSKQYLKVEQENVLRACNAIVARAANGDRFELSPDVIKGLNAAVLAGLECEDHVIPGEYRTVSVGVMNYRGPDWQEVPELVNRKCKWLNGPDFDQLDEWRIPLALVRAILAHLYIAWIHPFGDGNGRTARLIEYAILVDAGIPSPAGHLLSNHYNETRSEYYRQLDYSSKSGGDISKFIAYALQGFVDGLKLQLEIIHEQQRDLAWTNYVYEAFRARPTPTTRRRRQLVIALNRWPEGVRAYDVPGTSSEFFSLYRNTTVKTITRDLNEGVKLGLVENNRGVYRARVEIIDAFLPFRREPEATVTD